jgi:hypothetical protein
MSDEQNANATAYRELCKRMGCGPWNTADLIERARLHAIGLREGWLTETPALKADSGGGGAWNRTNPPKRGKRGNAKWRR